MTVADDLKPHNRLARRCDANAQSLPDTGTALQRAVHETYWQRLGCVLKASPVNAKAFLAEAGASMKIADGPFDKAQVPVPLSLYQRSVSRIGCADEDTHPGGEQATTNSAE